MTKWAVLLLGFTLLFSGCARFRKEDPNPTMMPPAPALTALAVQTEFAPQNLETKNIPYTTTGHVSQKLDIYLPEKSDGTAPVMIYVHGGAWTIGDKSRTHFKDDIFNDLGYIFISVNYRLSPDASWDLMAEDIATAIKWVYENIPTYGGNSERIFLMGHSAGAHLVSLVATDESYLQNIGLDLNDLSGVVSLDTRAYNIPKLADGDTLPRLYANIFGNDPQIWEIASPISHVEAGKNIPPITIAWSKGGNDNINNAAEREEFANEFSEALNAVGVSTLLADGSTKTHAEINHQFGEPDDALTQNIIDWLNQLK